MKSVLTTNSPTRHFSIYRKQKGQFGRAFSKHFSANNEKVESWKKALVDASNIAGWETNRLANGHEAVCIKKIVGSVLDKLQSLNSSVDDDELVGMVTRLQDLKSQLEIGSGGVRMVGIWGVGGGGKTTLATSLYMEISANFNSCCFVDNIREESRQQNGLKKLQEKIISTVFKEEIKVESVDIGKQKIKHMLCTRNVLVVLDDVDALEQLEALAGRHNWFGDGSRIIITTRDENVLKSHRVDEVCPVSLLSDDEATQLFRKHAYREVNPVEDYDELSLRVIKYVDGLPLALKVLGSFLYDKDKSEWMRALDNLNKTPNLTVTEQLKISYDGLNPCEKELFLDIACFFRGYSEEKATKILDACGFYSRIGVMVLKQKSLITISKDGKFDMLNLVQEMGHHIVRGKDPDNPEKHSRVWRDEDIEDMCARNATTENHMIEAIQYECYECDSEEDIEDMCAGNTTRENHMDKVMTLVSNLKKLRFLHVSCVHGCHEGATFLSNDLKYIDFLGYPASLFPESFQPRKLVVLKLTDTLQKELWKGYKYMPCLKELELMDTKALVRTPDISGLPCLQNLIIEGCERLEEIHPSIGSHSSLVYISVRWCPVLTRFPTIVRMEKLKTLEISNCDAIHEFPKIKSNMDSLENLDLMHLGIEVLPSSVGRYCTNLISLKLHHCSKLKTIEGNFHALKRLEKFEIYGDTQLEKFPEDLVHYRDVKPKVDDYDDDGDVSGVSSVTVETPPPTQLDIYQTKYPEDMVTHNRVLTTISAALEDKSKQFIGIYGLGGVGKTTLAKEVVARLKNTNMFDDVAFTTVSQKVDVEKIKKDLENAKLRMMKGDRILIILDDVWEKLNLEELGIQCGNNYMNCKILLTSRSKEVCRKMSAQSMIHLNLLPTEEAWILFKRVVGGRLETDANLKPVARKVVEECGGLPLLIQAIGNALKDENIQSWESALSQLKEPAASEMERDIEKAFTRLRLSYEYLKSEEAKSCFLLCSFFPEDDDISLEDLVCYLVGLEKFDSIKDARDRVQNAVNILISSGLLLNGKWEGYTKMHDVVRDVALLIASKDENKFLVEAGKGLKEWLPGHNMLESYTGISLMKNWISKLPDYEVHLSSLDIFLVNNNPLLRMISDEFIKGMKEVKVLDMGWCLISHLPQSLKLLTKLRMLNLEENYLFHEISILGEMKELEILILNRTGIKEIPKEIGQLVNLRRLEVSGCRYMTRVTPGVISKLQSLEELCINLSRVIEGANGCTAEVMKLLKLTFLDLVVKSCEVIPEGFNLEKLNGFVIQIGEYHRDFYRGNELRMSDRYLIISSKHLVIPLLKRIEKFIEVSRLITILNGIQNLNNIMPELYHGGFNKLEHIQLNYCHNVLCLLEDCTRCDGDEGKTEEKLFKELKHLKLWYLDNLEVLWKYECVSLTNLVSLLIEGCDKLERVFTVSVAQGLVNLKKLGIEGCSALEEVIWGGGGGGGDDKSRNVIVFPSLATISLIVLERLKMFFNSTGNCSIEYPSLVYVKIHDCESMKIWGLGIHETPNLKRLEMDYVEPIVVDGPFAINEAVEKLWRK